MDTGARVRAADEHSAELLRTFSDLQHRIQAFTLLQQDMAQLHSHIQALKGELVAVKAELSQLQGALPSVARKEEFERLAQKVNAIPFETMATKRDI
jgi:hypothetical protein